MKIKRLLVVGGTGRDVGKTEFICRLISKTSENVPVYALKVSAIYPDEELFHGTHSSDEKKQHLFEEVNKTTAKDTSRMLRAGARKVFYLRSDNEGILSGYTQFLERIPEDSVVICESNSLAQVIPSALSIVVKSTNAPVKPRAIPLLESADLIVVSDCQSGFAELEQIRYRDQDGWVLKQCPE